MELDEVRRRARSFDSAAALHAWFADHCQSATEIWIAYPKKGSGRIGISYSEAVDEALCFGWIDGQLRSLDADRYANRYTPRRARSRWSQVNVERARALLAEGRMHPAGRAAFEARGEGNRAGYSNEERARKLEPDLDRRFRASGRAYRYFRAQPPSYQRTVTFWVMSAKQAATRTRRLTRLIDACRRKVRVDLLAPGRRDAAPSKITRRRRNGRARSSPPAPSPRASSTLRAGSESADRSPD